MPEQYAFAIGFDVGLTSDGVGEWPNETWANIYEKIATTITDAGLPSLESERWDEFGQGRIFWGSKAECELAKQVLAQFDDLYIEEARNLETGYYGTASHTYFVDETGEIYILHQNWSSTDESFLTRAIAIPLDAYRLRKVDPPLIEQVQQRLIVPVNHPNSFPEMTTDPQPVTAAFDPFHPAVQESLMLREQVAALSSELDTLKTAVALRIAPEVHAELQTHYAYQVAELNDLETKVTHLETQIGQLQGVIAAKIDPEVHARVQAQADQDSQRAEILQVRLQELETVPSPVSELQVDQPALARVAELEQRLVRMEQEANVWKTRAEQGINAKSYETLQQQLAERSAHCQSLEQIVARLEQQQQEASAIAAQRVDPTKYDALEQEVKDQKALITDLKRTLQQQERDLREWKTVAEAKVEWSEYQAVQDELKQFKMRRRKGLLGRLFS